MNYLIYYHYTNLSLLDSSLALLKELGIDALIDEDFRHYGGHWGWLVNEQIFFLSQAYNIAKASSLGRDLLVLEEDAYINLVFAKKHIDENPSLFALVESELNKLNLKYIQDTKIIYLCDLLAKNEILDKIKSKQKASFDAFSASIFHSSRKLEAQEKLDSKDSRNFSRTDSLSQILTTLGLKVAYEGDYAFFQNALFNPRFAYKYSAKMLESALDSGSDIALCASMGVFEMLDGERKKLSKEINRDLSSIPALFLPQIILMSFGIKDDTQLALRYHKIAPDFL